MILRQTTDENLIVQKETMGNSEVKSVNCQCKVCVEVREKEKKIHQSYQCPHCKHCKKEPDTSDPCLQFKPNCQVCQTKVTPDDSTAITWAGPKGECVAGHGCPPYNCNNGIMCTKCQKTLLLPGTYYDVAKRYYC